MFPLPKRLLPVDCSSFREIRQRGMGYVDKSAHVWRLAQTNKFYYLARPRRFGKSMLIDTLACYYAGRRELFEGLQIMEMETEWKKHPVLRLDMSKAGSTPEVVRAYLDSTMEWAEKQYGVVPPKQQGLPVRLDNFLRQTAEQYGTGVAVLIDEYDAPLQTTWGTPLHEECTAIYRDVFTVLKADADYEAIVFITGVARFSHLSLFSTLNNLRDISFLPQFATLCGITEQELADTFMPEIEEIAEKNGWTAERTLDKLREKYDGYHFCADTPAAVYNPFSLTNALYDARLGNYWVSSGATRLLAKFVKNIDLGIRHYDDCEIDRTVLESSDITSDVAELFLYQSGYLTIKSCDDDCYQLTIPNEEVRKALYGVVFPMLTMREDGWTITTQGALKRQLNRGQLPEAMDSLKALIADAPYSNKRLASIDMEERYRFLISSLFHAIGIPTEVERMKARGRMDIVSRTAKNIYIFELKLTKNGGLAEAEKQIREKEYTAPFQADPEGRPVHAVAVELQDEGKGLLAWKLVED